MISISKKVIKKCGAPKKDFDKELFENLCRVKNTQKDICLILKTSDKTLVRWCKETYNVKDFTEAYEQFSADGRASLRKSMHELAKTNAIMAIWLSKNELGYKDNRDELAEVKKELALEQLKRIRIENEVVSLKLQQLRETTKEEDSNGILSELLEHLKRT